MCMNWNLWLIEILETALEEPGLPHAAVLAAITRGQPLGDWSIFIKEPNLAAHQSGLSFPDFWEGLVSAQKKKMDQLIGL